MVPACLLLDSALTLPAFNFLPWLSFLRPRPYHVWYLDGTAFLPVCVCLCAPVCLCTCLCLRRLSVSPASPLASIVSWCPMNTLQCTEVPGKIRALQRQPVCLTEENLYVLQMRTCMSCRGEVVCLADANSANGRAVGGRRYDFRCDAPPLRLLPDEVSSGIDSLRRLRGCWPREVRQPPFDVPEIRHNIT